MIIAGGLTSRDCRNFPRLRARIGIEVINTAVLRNYEEGILDAQRPGQFIDIERLRIHLAIDREEASLSERGGIDVGGRQSCLR